MKFISSFAVVFLFILISCKKDGSTVVKSISITTLTPDSGAYGNVVTIIGKNLVSPDSVKLNGKLCPIKNVNGDTVRITVPKAAGSGPVVVFFKDTSFTWPMFHFRYTSYVTTLAYCKNISNANAAGPDNGYIWPYDVAADTSGNVYIAGFSYTPYVRKLDSNHIFTSVAGNGQLGFIQGPAASARFSASMYEIARDNRGNLAVYDQGYYSIRKIGADGMVSIYAGNGQLGHVNGSAAQSQIGLNGQGMAFNSKGELYFSDEGYIRKVSSNGMVSDYIGNGTTLEGTSATAPAEADTSTALFIPRALCFDRHDNLIFGDGPYIRMATPDGKVKKLAGTVENAYVGGVDGPVAQASFYIITGIAVDKDGNIYVSEFTNRIRKLGTDGIVTTIAGSSAGFADGPAEKALFNNPYGIALDKNGDLIVADKDNYRIRKIVIQ